jgi:hypothetical protein
MHRRIITGLIIFIVLFSLQGFSQTTDNSEHPLLDKYYPHADTNKTITNQIKPVYQIKSAPAATNISARTTKPLVTATTIPADTSATIPAVTTTTVPSVTTTSSLTTTPDVTTISALTTTPVVNKQDTVTATSVVKPETVTARIPVQEKVQPQHAPTHPYIDTRLGSSTPQYDTWEKNSNGAGSVTTSPK